MNTRSIRFQLTVWHALLLVGFFSLVGLSMYFGLKHYVESSVGLTQTRRAEQIGTTLLANARAKDEPAVVNEIKALYAPEANDRFIRVTRGDGSVLYVSNDPKDQSFALSGLVAPVFPKETESLRFEPLHDGKTLLIAAVKQTAVENRSYLVEVGVSTLSLETMLAQFRRQLFLGLPIVTLAAMAGGYWLVGRALAPVERIARKAEQITQHNLSERLPSPETGDELERLSHSLNHMIARLEDALMNSKRFVADASHELRTPLTVLRSELESLVTRENQPREMRDHLGSLLEETERLAKIVERLFALSRLDAGEAQTEWARFDLGELVTTTAGQMNLLAEDKGIGVTCDCASEVAVEGDRARLKQVVVNLLDNAIKYTSSGGAVRLSVQRQNGHGILEISDTGMGIPESAVPHVFDRFFRVDQARSSDQGGAGLGLAIVKSICAAHGADVEVESKINRGSVFRVRLPAVSKKTST